ncbi:LysE family transporter [Oscillatoria sp. FACHB-1407]|uniref:LysE/ArgO family amino acid transporter n=1 Tax=Oscillatoria sp. FACHB-1407 TaxID=2692847 RepID=UPI001688D96B|nr:LysE family transporter [Oscillatoria sp. FACHB-1407]MBD2460019.1 LysE family transporter [Oscillatoria sp. FACHB-1407]
MDIALFGRGLLVGLAIAAPVGPIGVLCIQRTLQYGQRIGLSTGLGAATADAIYGVIAGFGLTFISGILIGHAIWFRFIGGAFLLYLGIMTIRSAPAHQAASKKGYGLWGAYFSTVVLTITNPATILSFAAVFAGLGLASTEGDYWAASILVLGVFSGSALWWLLLTGGISLFRKRFKLDGLQWLNKISGIVLIIFGVVAITSLPLSPLVEQ